MSIAASETKEPVFDAVGSSGSQAVVDALAAFEDALAAPVAKARERLESVAASVKLAADDFVMLDTSVSDIIDSYMDGTP